MDVRAEILSTATRLFARRGYEGTSLSAIAGEVGIRKPSLLYHFTSKEELRRSVLDHLIQHWNEVLPQLLSAVSSGRGRFDALTRALVSFFEEDRDRARLVLRELMDRPDDMRARLTIGVRPWIDLLADFIRKGQESGDIRTDVDPQVYVVHVITLALAAVATDEVMAALVPGDDIENRYREELLRIPRASLFDGPDDPTGNALDED